MKKKVLLGMSGGVDSSVAAILLKEQGYDVVGVTLVMFENKQEEGKMSPSEDAKQVCNQLGIPHYTFDFSCEFKKHVIDNFICEYAKCRTPNPCIECNRYLKFTAMYEKAIQLGCDYIATGHYAKAEYDSKYNRNVIKKSDSIKKDQSYVLYNIPPFLLDKIKFPLGCFKTKDEIREIARMHSLTTASKPDSEDICFVPDGNYKNFLEKNSEIKSKTGNIVNKSGKVLGKHTGLYKYTIGQRKGLGITNPVPLFVIGFNPTKNELIVGEENELYKNEFSVSDVNLLLLDEINEPIQVQVKTRYSAKAVNAQIIRRKQ